MILGHSILHQLRGSPAWCQGLQMLKCTLQYYSPPYVDRIRAIWGSYFDIPKAIFYLLRGDCNDEKPKDTLKNKGGFPFCPSFNVSDSAARLHMYSDYLEGQRDSASG